MVYSKLFASARVNKNVRVLGVAAVFSLVVGVVLFVHHFIYVNGLNTIGSLKKMQIVNLTSNGTGVVWEVKNNPTDIQWVEWGESMNIMDHKSPPGAGTGSLKYMSITGMEANKIYYVRIRSYAGVYTWEGKRAIQLKTPKVSQAYPQTPAYGKVLYPSGRAYTNGIVFFEVEGYVPQVAFTKETGEWLVSLNGFVDKKTNVITSIKDNAKVTIRIPSSPETVVVTTAKQIAPMSKIMVIGTSSTFLAQGAGNESVLGATTEKAQQEVKQPSITYPKEGALIPGNTPLIKGTAVENKELNVLIQGPKKQYSYRVVADGNGDWLVQYPLALEPGRYVVSATTQDRSGFKLTLRRTFSIIKNGEQVLGEATGSPTLAPTAVPTIPAIPTPTTASVQPTTALSPTAAIPTVLVPTQFVPSPTPPRTGGEISGYLFTAAVCIVLGAGLVLVF